MAASRMTSVAVAAVLLGAAAGYVVGRRGTVPVDPPQPQQQQRDVITVTPRQVEAAQIAIKAKELLGEPIPPGLQRIANARPPTPADEHRFYARPENQVPQGRPRRRRAR